MADIPTSTPTSTHKTEAEAPKGYVKYEPGNRDQIMILLMSEINEKLGRLLALEEQREEERNAGLFGKKKKPAKR